MLWLRGPADLRNQQKFVRPTLYELFYDCGGNCMDLPMLDFLKEKNTHTGSEGNFRYKLKPDGEEIKVWAYQTYCLEYCQEHGLMLGEESFPLDAQGLEAAAAWLAEQQKKL